MNDVTTGGKIVLKWVVTEILLEASSFVSDSEMNRSINNVLSHPTTEDVFTPSYSLYPDGSDGTTKERKELCTNLNRHSFISSVW